MTSNLSLDSIRGAATRAVTMQPVDGEREWNTKISDCCTDCKTCVCGFFCMCCMLCNIADRMNESRCVTNCFPAGMVAVRTKMRLKYNIKGSIYTDYCTYCGCFSCMICQMEREFRYIHAKETG